MEQKQRFVSLAESGHFTVSELCREFGISRKTGHKWLTRYRLDGRSGLEEKSRAPNVVPGKIELEIERPLSVNAELIRVGDLKRFVSD